MSSPVKIFIAYSREDSKLMEKLRTHLRPLERARMAKIWYDGIIEVGNDWEKEIKNHLHSAQIILLLISADFIDSDYCYDEEMMDALKKEERNEAKVIPIILRPCAWSYSPFAKLQVLPTDGKPVIEHEDYAFTEIVESVGKICQRKIEIQKAASKAIDEMLLKKKQEEDIPYFETPEMKEVQGIADSILSGEFFTKKSNSNIHNSFSDPRDGQTYKTVKLKDGRIWMAKNLNYDVGDGSYFYEGNRINGKNYGRLYTLDAAHQAVPPGWRIPTRAEWEKMITAYAEWDVISFSNSYNKGAFPFLIDGGSSEFNALYGGLKTDLKSFNYLGKFGNYWGSDRVFVNQYYVIQFERGLSKIVQTDKNMEYALSVRCIKDE
ncbi:MAG: FISUMP domain-containing protein [Saprospiraceae bacterium]